MSEFNIGEIGKIIKTKREKINISQEQLTEGLCNVQTISKIERGTQLPRHGLMVTLMERLRMPTEQYFGVCNATDWEIEEYRSKIKIANARGDYKESILLKNELKEKHGADNIINQFCAWMDAINGKLSGCDVESYKPDKKLELLNQAIRMTIPRFDKDNIDSTPLSLTEIHIINSIANVYCTRGDIRKA